MDGLAAQMASVILGESGKTISDRDRALVRSMLGSVENLQGAVQSEEVIRQRLEDIEKLVLTEMTEAEAGMDAFEGTYAGAVIKGTRAEGAYMTPGGQLMPGSGKQYSDIFERYKTKTLGGEEYRLGEEAETRGREGQYTIKGDVYDYAALPEGASLADVLRAQAES